MAHQKQNVEVSCCTTQEMVCLSHPVQRERRWNKREVARLGYFLPWDVSFLPVGAQGLQEDKNTALSWKKAISKTCTVKIPPYTQTF